MRIVEPNASGDSTVQYVTNTAMQWNLIYKRSTKGHWENVFVATGVRYIRDYYWAEEYRSLYRSLPCLVACYIGVPLYNERYSSAQ